MRFLRLAPALEFDPLVRLQVLVVLEEMGDALQVDLGAVALGLHTLPQARDPAEWHRQDFVLRPRLVPHPQHADRSRGQHGAPAGPVSGPSP
jgi:hypothetical protein